MEIHVLNENSESYLLEEYERNQHEVVLNPNRRVPFTDNFFKRFQGSVTARNSQENVRVAVLSPQAAIQYISGELLPNIEQYFFPKKYDNLPDSAVPDHEDVEAAATSQEECDHDNYCCKLFYGKYKKRALAVVFVILEAISFVLDLLGKSKWNFLLAAFLLSALGFAVTIYINCVIERRCRLLQAHDDHQRQLRVVVEIVFSVVQLFVTFIHFILVNFNIKNNNYNASVSPLAFAVIVLVFVFKKDGDDDQDDQLLTHASAPRNLWPDHNSTSIEEVINIPLNDNNPVTVNVSSSTTPSEDSSDEMMDKNSYLVSPAISKTSNLASRKVEVHMFTTGVNRKIDLETLSCYEDLYRKVEELFNIEGQLFGFRSEKQLVYVGDDDFVLILGDDPWNEFCKVVRKIFIYIR